MASGPYERFYPGEDRGLVDLTSRGGPYRLSAPSVSKHGGTIGLLTTAASAGLGAYRLGLLGYQGIEKAGQALDKILPALKPIIKKGIPVWGEGVLDYGADKQTEKEVEKVVKKVKKRREPIPRQRTGVVSPLVSSNLTGASLYSRAEDAVINARMERGTVPQWISEIGRGGGKKELNMTGGLDSLKEVEGGRVLSKPEVLSLLQPYIINLEETYYTSAHRAEGRFPEPRWADNQRINLQSYSPGNPVEIVLSLDRTNAWPSATGYPYNYLGSFEDSDWPGVKDPLVHIRGNDGKLFNSPAFIVQEIQSNLHQKAAGIRAEEINRKMELQGFSKPYETSDAKAALKEVIGSVPNDFGYYKLMPQPDDIEIKTVSLDEAMSDTYRDNYPGYSGDWMDKTDLRDWREGQGVPVDAPVTLYKLKSEEITETDGVISGWQMHPRPDITADELWEVEFQHFSMNQLEPDDPFYKAWAASTSSRVLNAPYKKDWYELGFKRSLMEALRDPNKEYLAWTTGEVQAERAFGENWEVNFPQKSKFHLNLYNRDIVKFSKKFLGVTPQQLEPRGWNVFVPGTGRTVQFFESEQEAKDYSERYNDEYERSESELWYIKITDEMRDKYIKVLEDELGAPPEVQMPTAQIEGGGLLGRYA